LISRTDTIPEDFLQHLRDEITGFSIEKDEHQFAIARMAWIGALKKNQHSHFKGWMSFSDKGLDKAFGRNKFAEINQRLSFFFITASWSHEKKYTRGYVFKPAAHVAVRKYLARPRGATLIRLITADSKVMRTVPSAVSSKDKDGVTTTAWASAKALNLVKVDLVELERLKQELLGDCKTHRSLSPCEEEDEFLELIKVERVIAIISRVQVLSHTESSGLGVMAQHYVQATSGRIYPEGISLASTPGIIKDAALVGHWEYDISNCHFAIVSQMAHKHGYTCTAIDQYLANKAEVRNQISEEAGISKDQAKMCLLALLYGARLTAWHTTAIAREIGKDSTLKLIEVSVFRELEKAIKEVRTLVLSKCDWSLRGWLKNDFGKSIGPANSKEQQFAHLLQGIDAKALQAAIELYPSAIVLAQHDGFVANSRLDTGALSAAVWKATGYNLSFEESQLKPDPGVYFDGRL
jgi:hypothetical protein